MTFPAYDDDELSSYASYGPPPVDESGLPLFQPEPPPGPAPSLAGPSGPRTPLAAPPPVDLTPDPEQAPTGPIPDIAGPAGPFGPPGEGAGPALPPPVKQAVPGAASTDWRVRVHELAGFVPGPTMTMADAADLIYRRTGKYPAELTGPEPQAGSSARFNPDEAQQAKPGATGGGHLGAGAGIAANMLPPDLQPELGGNLYPADYEQRVTAWLASRDAAAAVGGGLGGAAAGDPAAHKLAAQALQQHATWKASPLGQQLQMVRLQEQAAQIRAQGDQDRMAREIAFDEQARGRAADWATREREFTEAATRREIAEKVAYDDWQKRVAAADKAVDEVQIGDDRNIAQRFFDVIVAAIGELGAGLSGRPNTALEIIRDGVKQRIEGQKTQLAAKQQRAGQVRNDLQTYQQHFDREEDAANALQARYLREVQSELGLMAQDAQTDIAKQRLQELHDLTANAADQADQDTRNQIQAALLARPAGGGGGGASAEAPGAPHNARPGTIRMVRDQDFADRFMPKIGAYVAPGYKKEVAEATLSWTKVKELTEKARKIIEADKAVRVKWDKTQAKLDAIIPGALQAISKAAGGGVITDNDIMKEALQNPKDWFASNESAASQLETWGGIADTSISDVVSTYGGQFGDRPGYVGEDDKGNARYEVHLRDYAPEVQAQQRATAAAGAGYAPDEEPELGNDVAIQLQQDVAEWEAQHEPQPKKKRRKKGEED